MNKADLEHENKTLKQKVEILELRLEREEVWHSVELGKLNREIEDLKKDKERGAGGSHAIGFQLLPTYEYDE